MLIVALALFSGFLGYGLLGLPTAFLLLPPPRRFETALALAPTVGFLLASLVVSGMVRADYPIHSWSYWAFWSSVTVNGVIVCALCLRQFPNLVGTLNLSWLALLGGGFLLTFILVVTPYVIGGLSFSNWRGNPWDALNYMDMAVYLNQVPLDEGNAASVTQLMNRNPCFPAARELLSSRWTTSGMLAFTSEVTCVPICRMEFGYSALMFVFAFGPALLLAEGLPLRHPWSLAVAVSICVGFWAQFVLDIRAVSQCNSIPTVLSLAFLATFLGHEKQRCLGIYILQALTFGTLTLLYPEILPLVVSAFGLYCMRLFCSKSAPYTSLLGGTSAMITGLLVVLPIYNPFHFLECQSGFVLSTGSTNWAPAFFLWMYKSFLVNAWGFRFLSTDSRFLGIYLHLGDRICFPFMCFFLWLGLFSSTLAFVARRNFSSTVAICLAFAITGSVEAGALFCCNRLWPAGKAISCAYPFFMLCAVFPFLTGTSRCTSFFLWGVLLRIGNFAIICWLGIQLGSGLYRIGNTTPPNCPQYLRGTIGYSERGYRYFHWDFEGFRSILQKSPHATIAIDVRDHWVRDFVVVSLCRFHLCPVGAILERNTGALTPAVSPPHAPDFLILDANDVAANNLQEFVIAGADDLRLLKVSGASSVLVYLAKRGWKWD